jgi:hypothetical protein
MKLSALVAALLALALTACGEKAAETPAVVVETPVAAPAVVVEPASAVVVEVPVASAVEVAPAAK